MSLTNSEIARIKAELGFNLLSSAAAPFVNTYFYFEQIVQRYLTDGTSTTSATAVTAASAPTPVTIVLASAAGFASGSRINIDCDDRLESVTIQSLSGANAVVALQLAHSGTYSVQLDSGESIIREYLAQIKKTKLELSGIYGEGALKKVDEIEFYQSGSSLFGSTAKVLNYWRNELAQLLGTVNMFAVKRGSGGSVAIY